MARLPKPLLGLLLGTIVFFAIWMVALKPKSSAGGGSQGGVGQYQSAIDKAHQAVTTSNQANAKLGAPTATAPAPKPATPAKAAPTATTKATSTKSAPAKAAPAKAAAPKAAAKAATTAKANADIAQSPAAGIQAIQSGIRAGKVVAVLFYNDAAADDRAVKKELAEVPTHHGKVVKLAVPVSQLSQYSVVTQQIPVVTAPTLVLIDASRQATTITGYADPVEIAQRISDALTVK
jgi:hypothetical protein